MISITHHCDDRCKCPEAERARAEAKRRASFYCRLSLGEFEIIQEAIVIAERAFGALQQFSEAAGDNPRLGKKAYAAAIAARGVLGIAALESSKEREAIAARKAAMRRAVNP